MTGNRRSAYELGPMPSGCVMTTVDELLVRSPLETIFTLAADVERWPKHLVHYRRVQFRERAPDGGGLVEMAADRPFGSINWPTRWTSEMQIQEPGGSSVPFIRYRHVEGITTGMDVEWSFSVTPGGTQVRIVHVWNGPRWPLLRVVAARAVIGPVFVHGIASRTLAGLAAVARNADQYSRSEVQRG